MMSMNRARETIEPKVLVCSFDAPISVKLERGGGEGGSGIGWGF